MVSLLTAAAISVDHERSRARLLELLREHGGCFDAIARAESVSRRTVIRAAYRLDAWGVIRAAYPRHARQPASRESTDAARAQAQLREVRASRRSIARPRDPA